MIWLSAPPRQELCVLYLLPSVRMHGLLMRRLSFFFLFATVLLSACSRHVDQELVIISPHSPEIKKEFTLGFTQWHKSRTGKTVRLNWLDVGGTGEAINYIKSRNTGGAGGVDVFFGGGDYPFIKLAGMGLLMPHRLPDSIIAHVPHSINGIRVYADDSLWYGSALSGFGIAYNKSILRANKLPLPAVWEDLARPEYFGWVSSGDPRYSGSVHVMYEIILQSYGWEKGWDVLCRMGANVQSFVKSASGAAKDVALGQAALGMVIDFYAFAEIDRYGKDRLGFLLPPGQTVISPDGIAILKNAANPELACQFVDYVLSDGQKLWALKKGVSGGPRETALCRFPVDSTLYSRDPSELAITENPFGLKNPLRYDGGLAGKRWDVVNDLIASRIIGPHRSLQRCWRSHGAGSALRACFSSGITDSQAIALSTQWTSKDFAAQRIRTMNAWIGSAQNQYRTTVRGNQ
jgi:ABC-type Fe3+ transport system substrate-binding protein